MVNSNRLQAKPWMFGLAIVLLIGAAVQLSSRRRGPSERGSSFLTRPDMPGAKTRRYVVPADLRQADSEDSGSADADAVDSGEDSKEQGAAGRLYATPELNEKDGFEMFLKLMSTSEANPEGNATAVALTEAIRKEPPLKKAYDDFRKGPPTKERIEAFKVVLSAMPEFRRLMARFASSPGAAGMLTPNPSAMAGKDLRGSEVRGGRALSGARAVDRDVTVAKWKQMALSGVKPSKYPNKIAGPQRSVPFSESSLSEAVSALQRSGAREAGASMQLTANAAKTSAHDVKALDKAFLSKEVNEEGKNQFEQDRRFMTRLLKEMPDEQRKKIQELLEACEGTTKAGVPGECDVWGACYAAGLYTECAEKCRSVVSGCEGERLNPWQACRSPVGGNESGRNRKAATCVLDCLRDGKYGCQEGLIAKAEWDQVCLNEEVAQGFCLSTQRWGTSLICDGPGDPPACRPVMGSRGAPAAVTPVVASSPPLPPAVQVFWWTPPPNQGLYWAWYRGGQIIEWGGPQAKANPPVNGDIMIPLNGVSSSEGFVYERLKVGQPVTTNSCSRFTGENRAHCETSLSGKAVTPTVPCSQQEGEARAQCHKLFD